MSESFADINFSNGETVKASRHNMSLYTHFGKGALYDHLWVKRDKDFGSYIWAQHPPENPSYALLAPIAVENDIEMHINIQKVSEDDLKAFGKAAMIDFNETPDWLPEV